MSVLLSTTRPSVIFDPTNKAHRKYYAEFRKLNTWGKCPVRFLLAEDQDNIVTMIQTTLAEFHTEREFGKIST